MDQLVGSNEVAQRLGWRHPQYIHHVRGADPSFPEPVATIGGPHLKTFVWYWPDVERWARKTGRLPEQRQSRKEGHQPGYEEGAQS